VVNLIGNLTLLAGFLPIDPLIVVAWTLSWEIVFYVTLPFLFWAGRLRTRSPGVRLAIIGVVWVGMSVSGALQSAGNARILLFLCGVAVAEWSAAGRPGRALLPVGAPIAALAAIGADVWCTFAGHIDAEGIHYPAGTWALWGRLGVYFVALPIVVAGAMEARGVVPTALARPLIRRMGDFSYSYYLSHALVIRAIGEIAGRAVDPATHKSGWWWFVALPPTFAATVVVAVILFLCVERPCSISPDPAVTVLPPRIVRWPWQAPPRSEAGRRTL
jgi:peptidoglycan/LPS O-acetylase OafA/YrhL